MAGLVMMFVIGLIDMIAAMILDSTPMALLGFALVYAALKLNEDDDDEKL